MAKCKPRGWPLDLGRVLPPSRSVVAQWISFVYRRGIGPIGSATNHIPGALHESHPGLIVAKATLGASLALGFALAPHGVAHADVVNLSELPAIDSMPVCHMEDGSDVDPQYCPAYGPTTATRGSRTKTTHSSSLTTRCVSTRITGAPWLRLWGVLLRAVPAPGEPQAAGRRPPLPRDLLWRMAFRHRIV